jgi:hypothetical protein
MQDHAQCARKKTPDYLKRPPMPANISWTVLPFHPAPETTQTQQPSSASGSLSDGDTERKVTFTTRSVDELLNFGATPLAVYKPPAWTNCVTGGRHSRTSLRTDSLPQQHFRERRVKFLADLTTQELNVHAQEMVQKNPDNQPRAQLTLNNEITARNAHPLQLKANLLQLHKGLPKLTEQYLLQADGELPKLTLMSKEQRTRHRQWIQPLRKHLYWTMRGADIGRQPPLAAGQPNPVAQKRQIQQMTALKPAGRNARPAASSALIPAPARAVIAKHFPYADLDGRLDVLAQIRLSSLQDMNRLLDRMSESQRAFHVICIAGDNNIAYRSFVVTENPSKPGQWLVHTAAHGVILRPPSNSVMFRNIDDAKADPLLTATRLLGARLLKTGTGAKEYEAALKDLVDDRSENGSRTFEKTFREFRKHAASAADKNAKDPIPDAGALLEDTEMFTFPMANADPLRYILWGNVQSKRAQPITVLSAGEDIMDSRLHEFACLGYEVSDFLLGYSIRDRSIRDAMVSLGCEVEVQELSAADPASIEESLDLPLSENKTQAIILEIEHGDQGDKHVMAWNVDTPEIGSDLVTGDTFEGTPLKFWDQEIIGERLEVKRITRSQIFSSKDAVFLSLLTGYGAREVQLDLAAMARKQGRTSGAISGFADLAHYFVSTYQDAMAASYYLGSVETPRNVGLGAVLDQSPHDLLLEYDDGEHGTRRILFDAFDPDAEPGDDVRRPSELLEELRKRGIRTINLFSMGSLKAAHTDPVELNQAVSVALDYLSKTGTGFDPANDQHKRIVSESILETNGGVPDSRQITLDMYVQYIERYNQASPPEDRILIKRNRIASGPVDVGQNPSSTLIQFPKYGFSTFLRRTNTITFHSDHSGHASFCYNLALGSPKHISRLTQTAAKEKWQDSGAVDILQLKKAAPGQSADD